jgi:hypothetical protein
MARVKKTIFYTGISLLSVSLLVILARYFIHLEFTYRSDEELYDGAKFLVPIIAGWMILAGVVRKRDTAAETSSKVFLTFIFTVFIAIIAFSTAMDGMCHYTNVRTIFQKKSDTSEKIVLRDFGCGATDSSPATVSVSSIKYYTSHFFIASPADTLKINMAEWNRIDQAPAHSN